MVYDEFGNEVDMETYKASEEELDENGRKPFRFGAEAEEKPKASKRRPGMPPAMNYGKDFKEYAKASEESEEGETEPEETGSDEERHESQQSRRREAPEKKGLPFSSWHYDKMDAYYKAKDAGKKGRPLDMTS